MHRLGALEEYGQILHDYSPRTIETLYDQTVGPLNHLYALWHCGHQNSNVIVRIFFVLGNFCGLFLNDRSEGRRARLFEALKEFSQRHGHSYDIPQWIQSSVLESDDLEDLPRIVRLLVTCEMTCIMRKTLRQQPLPL